MKLFFSRFFGSLKQWTLKWAHSTHMTVALFAVAFAEASFFPIPPDILIIAILLINSKRWIFYAGLTTIASVLGALLGYLIGWGFYETIGSHIIQIYNLQNLVDIIGREFSQHAFFTIFTAAFTPIPFKIITISAGIFKISLWKMVIASIVGRGLRYFTVAFMVKVFGKKLNSFIYKYFNIFSIIVILVILLAFLFYKL
ncbi:VTT domain-containing protein [Patescibacteria group bacterium]|nr:VTT domain-containing protein [Patescibacteria group bacterium]